MADAFYREVLSSRTAWTIRDSGGYPAPETASGRRSQPFWSKQSRAQKVLDQVAAYKGMWTEAVPYDDFTGRVLPGLERAQLLVGLNWSGRLATGYDLPPDRLLTILAMWDEQGIT